MVTVTDGEDIHILFHKLKLVRKLRLGLLMMFEDIAVLV